MKRYLQKLRTLDTEKKWKLVWSLSIVTTAMVLLFAFSLEQMLRDESPLPPTKETAGENYKASLFEQVEQASEAGNKIAPAIDNFTEAIKDLQKTIEESSKATNTTNRTSSTTEHATSTQQNLSN